MAETILNEIKRDFNILKEDNAINRKIALKNILLKLKKDLICLRTEDIDGLMKQYLKILLQNFSHNSDAIREQSCQIVILILSECMNLHIYVPYIIETLYERSNCHDLENNKNLPEEMQSSPSQKPFQMRKYIESVEEIRLNYVEIINTIIECCEEQTILEFMQQIVDIIRTLIIDKHKDVQKRACEVLTIFIYEYKNYLVHFGTLITRAVLNPLTSKKGRIRKVALKTLQQLLYIGSFKQSSEIMEILVGFKDPNYVAIKEFYEPSHDINYFAYFIKDENIGVRETFFYVLEDWLLNLPDKDDHFSRLFPYLLTGLFDESQVIQNLSVDILEQIGQNVEREKEKTFRDQKQLGLTPFWSFDGKLLEGCQLDPIKKRFRIGTRFLIQSNLSKIISPILRELKQSINFENCLKSLKLLKFLIFIVEDQIVEYFQKIFQVMIRNLVYDQNQACYQEIVVICQLIGKYDRFDLVYRYFEGFLDINNEFLEKHLVLFINWMKGYFQNIPFEQGLQYKMKNFASIIKLVEKKHFFDQNDKIFYNFFQFIQNVYEKFCSLKEKQKLILDLNYQQIQIFSFCQSNQFFGQIKLQKDFKNYDFKKELNYSEYFKFLKENLTVVNFNSLNFKILLHLYFTEQETDRINEISGIIFEIIKMNKWYNEDLNYILLSLLRNNSFSKKMLKEDEMLFQYIIYIKNYFQENEIKSLKNKENNIFPLLLRILDILKIKNLKDEKIEIFLQQCCTKLSKVFIRYKSSKQMDNLLKFLKKMIKLQDQFQEDTFGNCFEVINIYLSKFLIIKDIDQNYNSHLQMLKLLINIITQSQKIKNQDKQSSLLTIMKIYQQTTIQIHKDEIFSEIKENLIKNELLLVQMLQTAEKEQRLFRLEFLKKIWKHKFNQVNNLTQSIIKTQIQQILITNQLISKIICKFFPNFILKSQNFQFSINKILFSKSSKHNNIILITIQRKCISFTNIINVFNFNKSKIFQCQQKQIISYYLIIKMFIIKTSSTCYNQTINKFYISH